MDALITVKQIVEILANVLIMLVIIQFIIGLLFAFNVINTSNQFLHQVYNSINALLEPVLGPIRRIMPATGAIDFSPIVLITGLYITLAVIDGIIRGVA